MAKKPHIPTPTFPSDVVGLYQSIDGFDYEVWIGNKGQLWLKCLNCPLKSESVETEAAYIQRLIDFKTLKRLQDDTKYQ